MILSKNSKYLSGINCAELVPSAASFQEAERCAPSHKNTEVGQLEIQFSRMIQDNKA